DARADQGCQTDARLRRPLWRGYGCVDHRYVCGCCVSKPSRKEIGHKEKTDMLIKLVLFVAMAGGTAFAQAAQTPIVEQGNLIRTVANLDKSVAFYQDLLGLQIDP